MKKAILRTALKYDLRPITITLTPAQHSAVDIALRHLIATIDSQNYELYEDATTSAFAELRTTLYGVKAQMLNSETLEHSAALRRIAELQTANGIREVELRDHKARIVELEASEQKAVEELAAFRDEFLSSDTRPLVKRIANLEEEVSARREGEECARIALNPMAETIADLESELKASKQDNVHLAERIAELQPTK